MVRRVKLNILLQETGMGWGGAHNFSGVVINFRGNESALRANIHDKIPRGSTCAR